MEAASAGKNNKGPDKKTFKDLLVEFMGYTTAHGIGRLAESKTMFWKIFWSLVCLGAFGMFLFQAYRLFTQWLSRPVSTSMKMTFEKKLTFPAVTICNLNMIRKDAMPDTLQEALRDKLDYDYSISPNDPDNGTNDGSGNLGGPENEGPVRRKRSEGSVDSSSQPPVDPAYDYLDYDDEFPDVTEIDPATKMRFEVALLIGGMSPSHLYKDGHLFQEMIKNCTWKGVDCGNVTKYWTRSWNFKYGNCYTFNGGYDDNGNPKPVLKSSKPGPSQGLTLNVDIQQSLYIGALTIEAGARVTLHDQGHMPFPYETGFSVSPGMATSIGLKKTLIHRLDRFQNGSCLSANELALENIYRRFNNVTRYSQQACMNSCLGLSQLSQCNCSEDAYPSEGIPCDIFDATVARCLKEVRRKFNNDELTCLADCRQPCTEEIIQKTISSSQWPSTSHKQYLESQLQGYKTKSEDNLLLNIFYNELNYERIEEKYSYGGVNLLADIGGQLGLWIGISVITCCEALELLVLFVGLFMNKLKTKKSQSRVLDVSPCN